MDFIFLLWLVNIVYLIVQAYLLFFMYRMFGNTLLKAFVYNALYKGLVKGIMHCNYL